MLLLNFKRKNIKQTYDFQINQAYKKNMVFTTEDWILMKHYKLDEHMAVGQYAWIFE